MELLPFNKIKSEEWNDFCLNSDSAWFRHTIAWINFCLSLNDSNTNLSFGVFEAGKIVALVPLLKQPLDGEDGLYEFAMGGTPIPYPAMVNGSTKARSVKVIKFIFENIDQLARENSIAYSRFFVDPLAGKVPNFGHTYNPFLQLGFNEISLTTNILDLSKPEEEIFKNFRDGFRYDIKAIAKTGFTVDFFDKDSVNDEIFKIYKEIYFSSAGREVGTPERWQKTYEFIKSGYAVLALEKNTEGRYISGVIIFVYKSKAYYAFGATQADFKDVSGVSHLLQWEIIKYLKVRGFDLYELGWNFYPIISDEVYSPKECNISFFKSGFGANILPLIRGEKFYHSDYLKRRKIDLIDKFVGYDYV